MLEVQIQFVYCLNPHPSPHLKEWWKNSQTLLQTLQRDIWTVQWCRYGTIPIFQQMRVKKIEFQVCHSVFWVEALSVVFLRTVFLCVEWSQIWNSYLHLLNELLQAFSEAEAAKETYFSWEGWLALPSVTHVVIRSLLGSILNSLYLQIMKYKTHRLSQETRTLPGTCSNRRLDLGLILGFCSQSVISVPLNAFWSGTCKHHTLEVKVHLLCGSQQEANNRLAKSGFHCQN